jgi:hypothetical protein
MRPRTVDDLLAVVAIVFPDGEDIECGRTHDCWRGPSGGRRRITAPRQPKVPPQKKKQAIAASVNAGQTCFIGAPGGI